MARALLIITSDTTRQKAMNWLRKAPWNTRVEFKGPKRTLPQNDRMWLLLTAVATQLDWHGQKYSADDWKDYFMHALSGGKWMPGEDGGMIPIGRSTSDLDKEDFGDLMELIEAFCARQNVMLPWVHESEVA